MASLSVSGKPESIVPTGAKLEALLTGSQEYFEAWVRHTIGGDFTWRVRPQDTPENRQMIIDSIRIAMERNNGKFPQKDAFLERIE